MEKLIVYGSQYGTTKRYAEKFSEMTGVPCLSYENVKTLSGYGLVIHFGGLYAGGVKGLKATVKALQENTKLIIVTVGLADVTDEENRNNIKKSILYRMWPALCEREVAKQLARDFNLTL